MIEQKDAQLGLKDSQLEAKNQELVRLQRMLADDQADAEAEREALAGLSPSAGLWKRASALPAHARSRSQ